MAYIFTYDFWKLLIITIFASIHLEKDVFNRKFYKESFAKFVKMFCECFVKDGYI